jgi:2-dehydro-3-deoxygluconokinase
VSHAADTSDKSVLTFGETMGLMSSDTLGPLRHCRAMTLGIGGSESNVAIALRRLGSKVTWIGKVGDDSLGDLVLREIGAEGVEVVGLRDPTVPTGLMLKERRTSRETKVWYYRNGSAGSRLTAADIDPERIRSASILHVTGITPALSESAAETTYTAIQLAREAGVTVSFDLNYWGRLWSREDAGRAYRRIVAQADIVFAGEDEAAIAVGTEHRPIDLAHRLVDAGAGQAIIKLGPDGAVATAGGQDYEQPAVSISAVDTVGAGDGFVAGFLAEYLLDKAAPECLATAVTVGAYACLSAGDWEGMPSRDELTSLTVSEPVTR